MIKNTDGYFRKVDVTREEDNYIFDVLHDNATKLEQVLSKVNAIERLMLVSNTNASGSRTNTEAPAQNTHVNRASNNYRYFYRGRTGLYLKKGTFSPLANLAIGESYDITHIAEDGRRTLKQMREYLKKFGSNRRHKHRVKDNYVVIPQNGRMVVTRVA